MCFLFCLCLQYIQFITNIAYIDQITMQRKSQLPRRAQSHNNYKPPLSLQLPRFHSRPKYSLLPLSHTGQSKIQSTKNKSQTKPIIKLNKAQMTQIVDKIKAKKNSAKIQQFKGYSKKITAYNSIPNKSKKCGAENYFNTEGRLNKETVMALTNKKISIRNQQSKGNKQLKLEQKMQFSNSIQSHQKIKNSEIFINKEIQEYSIHYDASSTQASQGIRVSDDDKIIWQKITQIFSKIVLQNGNLDWPEQYIVMDKHAVQKNIYKFIEQTIHENESNKIWKHIYLSRITIYMYSSWILSGIQTKTLTHIFEKIQQNSLIILNFLREPQVLSNKLHIVSKNNQLICRSVSAILNRNSVLSHHAILKNMLESCIKIQSFEFIEVLDKTLKWEILKMPSFPFLPTPIEGKQLVLVLDLDETLIHYDHSSDIFHVRPFAQEFIQKVSQIFEVVIFTAALQQYADQILNQIDLDGNIHHKLYRNHLTYIENNPIKDLSLLGRSLHKTIIVDNLSSNFGLQPENGIQIKSWYDDDYDEVLSKLYAALTKISQSYRDDVRIGIKQLNSFIIEQITQPHFIYQLNNQL